MKYVPKFGDRIAIRQYCRREVAAFEKSSSIVSKATQSLREKIQLRRTGKRAHSDDRSQKLAGNLNALKNSRTYQIGLFEEVEGSFIQVRERKGGGVRHLKASKDTPVNELLNIGKDLFFPQGKNKLGNINEFEFTLRDFTEAELDSSMTLGQLYNLRKVKLLRLYVSCKRIFMDAQDLTANQVDSHLASSLHTHSKSTEIVVDEHASEVAMLTSTPIKLTTDTVMASTSTTDTRFLFIDANDEKLMSNTSPLNFDGIDVLQEQNTSVSVDEEIQIGYVYLPYDNDVLDDTLPVETAVVQPPSIGLYHENKVVKLRLRRGNIFYELNAAFKDGQITVDDMLLEIEMVLPNGNAEKGEDNGGVLRDALSEYWETFILKCTTGNVLKVPMTRHDMKDEWENVAKVMVLGYNMAKYFPVALAKPFLSHCLHQEIKDDELLAAFLETIPSEDKEIAEQAIRDFKSIFGKEEWFEFLEAHDIKRHVTEDNLRRTLLEVAHKEMVQDPAYVAECWSNILQGLHLPPGGLDEVMSSLTPTTRKVVAMLQHEALNKRECQILDFLKKFIRTCSDVRLRKFLRFCTGNGFVCIFTQLIFV